jgi:hypothetical protein
MTLIVKYLTPYGFGCKRGFQHSPQTPLFEMSRAHLKRGASSTDEKTPCESPFFQGNL